MNFFRRTDPPRTQTIEEFYREAEEVRQSVQDKHDLLVVEKWKACVTRAVNAGNPISSVKCPCGTRPPSDIALQRCSGPDWVVEATTGSTADYQYVLVAHNAKEGPRPSVPKVRSGERHPLES